MSQFNQLTPAEHERLACLSEECGEVIQAIGKILRHGYESSHPDSCANNRQDLEKEIGQLGFIVNLMVQADDINPNELDRHFEQKELSIVPYFHHQ